MEVHAKETLRQCNRLENPGFVIAMQEETKAHDSAGQWYRSYGIELWEFN